MNFAVLISGKGGNMNAILSHCKKKATKVFPARWRLRPKVVISNNGDAPGLEVAKSYGIPAFHISSGKFRTRLDENAIAQYIEKLNEYKVELILLAGFMCILHPPFLRHFPRRIINIHPSLLPRYPGLSTTTRALANNENHFGITLHLVNAETDGGRILLQQSIPNLPSSKRNKKTITQELQKLEHVLYKELLDRINDGKIIF